MSKIEIWKDIPNYEGRYQVSSLGRVKSFKFSKERVLKCAVNSTGYILTNLYEKANRKAYKVHRLVMIAFIGESDLDVNHKNGIKTDNRLENLEYCTRSENVQHAFNTGLSQSVKGERHGRAKLTRACAERIKYGHKGMMQKDISEIYGISPNQVCSIRTGRTWKHI